MQAEELSWWDLLAIELAYFPPPETPQPIKGLLAWIHEQLGTAAPDEVAS